MCVCARARVRACVYSLETEVILLLWFTPSIFFLSFSLGILTLFILRENLLNFFQLISKKYSHVGAIWFVSISTLLIFNRYNFLQIYNKRYLSSNMCIGRRIQESENDKKKKQREYYVETRKFKKNSKII